MKAVLFDKRFELFFKAISYGVALCGLLSLFVTGATGIIGAFLFTTAAVVAWAIEDTKWQFTERVAVILILFAVPIFYLDTRFGIFGGRNDILAGENLSRLILTLSGIKLLQKKSDRDWIIIYLIAFFQMLLAAGMSISPLYLVSLGLFMVSITIAIIAFEIRKSARKVRDDLKLEKLEGEEKPFKKAFTAFSYKRLPVIAVTLLAAITLIAFPLFLALPRVGGAGVISSTTGGASLSTGFGDTVRLGEIGRLQQNNEIVMRAKLGKYNRDKISDFHWRGIALDFFDKKSWFRTKPQPIGQYTKNDSGGFRLDTGSSEENLVEQTIYLEALDTPVLFSLDKPIYVRGQFLNINKDTEGSLSLPRYNVERMSYFVISDVRKPGEESLRHDNSAYGINTRRYFQVPEGLDERIGQLAEKVISDAKATNRYDQAKAIETHLRNDYAYSLDMRAGGSDPVADFLFNIREGHCEYFASAMVLMLRTHGVAARMVNGFNGGEYNEVTDTYAIRQRNAHSWVEVYFPGENTWITFDPTPAEGRIYDEPSTGGIADRLKQYMEALETLWIQYVVSYDNQEQRSLFKSIRESASDIESSTSHWLKALQMSLTDWWKEVRGDFGTETSIRAIAYGIGYLIAAILGFWLLRRLYRSLAKLRLFERFSRIFRSEKDKSIVEFYQRMQMILDQKGARRKEYETPLEFAHALAIPEVVSITERYNQVRFGGKDLKSEEAAKIEDWLRELKEKELKK